MTKPLATGTTNDETGSTVDVEADCGILWSAAQQFAYLRLSEELTDNGETLEVDLLDSYYARAQRIAATYARLYLETEEGGDPSKKGRYYWMAFGAFASKTVGCLLDHLSVKATYLTGTVVDKAFDKVDDGINYFREGKSQLHSVDYNIISEGLGLGNFWLFMDVAPWHWLNNNYEDHLFDGMGCIHKRDVQKYADIPKEVTTQNLQWAEYSVSKINDLKANHYVLEGMRLVKEIENERDPKEKAGTQMEHLVAIANHEQEMILQKLLYNNSDFTFWIKRQRNVLPLKWVSPTYQLVLTHECETNDEALKSVAPDDVEVEILGSLSDGADSKTRMGWIGQAAEKFHGLMQDPIQGLGMEEDIKTIAGWVNKQDGNGSFSHPSSFK